MRLASQLPKREMTSILTFNLGSLSEGGYLSGLCPTDLMY